MPFFSEFSSPGRVWTEFGTKIIFFSFSAYDIPFWLKIMPKRGFLIFWIFLLFYSKFSSWVEYERNSVLKFCSAFLDLSHTVLGKNNAGKCFFSFLKCFAIFSEFSCLGRVWTEFRTKIFLSFSPYIIPFWLKIMPEIGFLVFLIFLAIFFGIFLPGSSMNGIQD